MELSGSYVVERRPYRLSWIVAVVAALGVRTAEAQSDTYPHRWATAISIGGTSVPEAFGNQCAITDRFAAVGARIEALFRPRRWLVTSADLRGLAEPLTGCKTVLPGPKQVGPNEWENWAGATYPNGIARTPLMRSAFRIGVESPTSPIFRATAGAGVIWTGHLMPFQSLAIGGSSSNKGIRLTWEIEREFCRAAAHEEHSRYSMDASGNQIPLPTRVSSYTARFHWTNVHIGVEVPLL